MNERTLMADARASWQRRVADLRLKGLAKEGQAFAFMQGVLATACSCGAMTRDRAMILTRTWERHGALLEFLDRKIEK